MPPYGRGGAGNIQALEQTNAKIASDLEANQTTSQELLPSDYLHREEPKYVRSGRGGAGNYYDPKEVEQSANLGGDAAATVSKASTASNPTAGRGGAGNYAFGFSADARSAEREKLEEMRVREKVREDVERGVGEVLAVPPKARVGDGGVR